MAFSKEMHLQNAFKNAAKSSLWASILLLPVVSFADEVASETAEMEGELAPYVVVATRTPLGLDRVSPSVDYVGKEEIELWQDRDLVDTLERISGLAVKTSGATGNVSSMFVRGANSDQTAIFLDGRRLNPTFSGQYDLESLSVSNLQSVQILKGGASVNFGSSGIGGVIDLRTESTPQKEGLSGNATAEFGSNGYQLFGLESTYTDDRLSFSIGGTQLNTDNERPHDSYERLTILPRFDYKLTDHLSVELVAQYSESDKELPGSLTLGSLTDYSETESWLLSPGIRYATDLLTAHLFYSRSSYIGEGVNYYPFYNEITGDEINLQIDYSATESLLLSMGAVYRNDDVFRRGLYQNNLQQAGVFGQAIWLLSDAFELRGGIRFDDFSDYDSAVTGSLEAIYTLTDYDLSFFAKLSTAYAPPSGQDLAYDENIDSGGNPTDTALSSEESVSYEVGLRQKLFGEKLVWSLLFFRNEIDEMIVYEDYSYYDLNWKFFYVGS
ncbi:MAG: TonB-dependent receptor plug domain-containing protein, partial [Opitutales bacterium]|nr:TonB-dependent receptor plug domain-containing protein [Opitutales bacterium]